MISIHYSEIKRQNTKKKKMEDGSAENNHESVYMHTIG